jgi:hypothetical protein
MEQLRSPNKLFAVVKKHFSEPESVFFMALTSLLRLLLKQLRNCLSNMSACLLTFCRFAMGRLLTKITFAKPYFKCSQICLAEKDARMAPDRC